MPADSIPAELLEAIDRFDKKGDEIVRALASAREAIEPPQTIYHYTNDAGLRGILESGQLWFTDIFDLNDPSELRHSFTHAVELVGRWAEKVGNEKLEARPFAKQFAHFRDHGGIEGAAHYFVCSFSARGDDLGQWRAYADNGRGYALGFDTRLLETAFALKDGKPVPNNSTFPVSYDEKELGRVQAEIVENVFDLVSLPWVRGNEGPRQEMNADGLIEYMKRLHITLTMHTLRAALFFKHWGYDNEAEYRFLQLFPADKPAPGVKRRFRPHQLVKYREFDWRAAAPKALTNIVLGPAADRVKSPKFVSDCLAAFGYEGVETSQSAIPYRAL